MAGVQRKLPRDSITKESCHGDVQTQKRGQTEVNPKKVGRVGWIKPKNDRMVIYFSLGC
jgi:hypothetical protein